MLIHSEFSYIDLRTLHSDIFTCTKSVGHCLTTHALLLMKSHVCIFHISVSTRLLAAYLRYCPYVVILEHYKGILFIRLHMDLLPNDFVNSTKSNQLANFCTDSVISHVNFSWLIAKMGDYDKVLKYLFNSLSELTEYVNHTSWKLTNMITLSSYKPHYHIRLFTCKSLF